MTSTPSMPPVSAPTHPVPPATAAASAPLVIVGGGVAGLELATAFGRARRRGAGLPPVVLIDRDSTHVWKPMLHTIAAGTRDVNQQQTAYLAQAKQAGFRYEPGELCGLQREQRCIELAALLAPDGREVIPARTVAYSTLILAVGSQANDFGTPGVAEHCFSIDSRAQAEAFSQELRLRLLQAMAQDLQISVAIVGGGATGVELAAELVGLVEAVEAYGAQGLGARLSVTLIDSGPRLLAAFPEDISAAVRTRLLALGVKVESNCRVQAATANGFLLADGRELAADLKVWAAGVKAPDFLANFGGLETTPANQLVVTPTLRTTRDPAIFAVGDCASLTPAGAQRPLPTTAQVAHQQAQHLIRHLPRHLRENTPLPPFAYSDLGALVSLAEYDAYGSLGKVGMLQGVTLKGRLAQISHVLLYRSHQARLHGFWRGGLLWLTDLLNSRLRSRIRLD